MYPIIVKHLISGHYEAIETDTPVIKEEPDKELYKYFGWIKGNADNYLIHLYRLKDQIFNKQLGIEIKEI